jgi:hypothetical protein
MKKIIYVLLVVCIVLGSCSTGEAAAGAMAKLFGGSSEALVFLDCRAVSEDEIEFDFSRPVTVKSLNFEPVIAVAEIEDGSTVKVRLSAIQKPGAEITADILVEDPDKNTINVLIPFRARNNKMPSLVINEIRTETSKEKCEFIEFKTLTAGNLGGMRVFILGNTNTAKQTIYEFLPVEVKKDEYIVLNLRTPEADCKNEYGVNLAESGGKNSSPSSRDFWIPGSSKLIHKEASAIYVLNQDDKALAAVMISDNAASWWAKEYLAEAAEFLFKQGAWKSADGKMCGPANAVNSANSTNTRTICRDDKVKNTNTAADWYITANSSASPGKPNDPKRYVPTK